MPKRLKCDCLNECGDDPWLRDGRAEPCDRLKERRAQKLQRDEDLVVLRGLADWVHDQDVKATLNRILEELR